MTTRLSRAPLFGALAVSIALASSAQAQEFLIPGQILVVNMISPYQGDETKRDSEPNLAVNPADTQQMAASAFTPNPWGGTEVPIYMSKNGGRDWALQTITTTPPFVSDEFTGTGDITLRFGSSSGKLYIAALEKPGYKLRILRASDFFTTDPPPMVRLIDYVKSDQPYVQAISVPVDDGSIEDRVYVGFADVQSPGPRNVFIYFSPNAATGSMPAGFQLKGIEKRETNCGQRGPARPVVHSDGTVYAVFFRYTANCSSALVTAEIVVVRDDNWGNGSGSVAFADVKDPSDSADATGKIVATVQIPFTQCPYTPDGPPDLADPACVPAALPLGKQRIGGQISIAVDPSNSRRVYIAWADGTTPDNYTIRVRGSTTGGETWSDDLRTVSRATNPSLAINDRGRVGFLYQRLVTDDPCIAPEGCWETHLERSNDDFASPHSDLVLHRAPDNNIIGKDKAGPLGDYNYLMSVGKNFYGVFSGNNIPDKANFPNDVIYRRKAEFRPEFPVARLFTNDGATVEASVDPFFFAVSDPIGLGHCPKTPWLCDFSPKMEHGLLRLKCLMHGCTVIDLLPRNCPLKFNCPGCARGGMCPPYYHVHLDGLKSAWRVGLLDSQGMPVAHRQFKTKRGMVVSFRPSKGNFIAGKIGSYLLAFEMESNGKVGTEYRVRARLARSDRHYEVADERVAKKTN